VVLELEGCTVHFRNMRRLGGIWLAKDERELQMIEGPLARCPHSTATTATCFVARSRKC
jgi:hypothetical protein